MISHIPEPLDALARDVYSFYERIMMARGIERTLNSTMTAVCTGASLIFQAEAIPLGFEVGTASCRIVDRDTHKRKLRIFTKNCLALQSDSQSAPISIASRHTWNTWNSLTIDLTAKQFGFNGTYYLGSEPFLSDIKTEPLPADEIKPFDRWMTLEHDLPEFRAWRASGREWKAMKPWGLDKHHAVRQKLQELSSYFRKG
jgi:hypothetical protein